MGTRIKDWIYWLKQRYHHEAPEDFVTPHVSLHPGEDVNLNWYRKGIDCNLVFGQDENTVTAKLDIKRTNEKTAFFSEFTNYPYKRNSLGNIIRLIRFELENQGELVKSEPHHILSIVPQDKAIAIQLYDSEKKSWELDGSLSYRNKQGIERAISMVLEELPSTFAYSLLGDPRVYFDYDKDYFLTKIPKEKFEELFRMLIEFSKVTQLNQIDVELQW